MTTDLTALVTAAVAHLEDASLSALCDWLTEHEREPEAVLLRRRWTRWKADRPRAEEKSLSDIRATAPRLMALFGDQAEDKLRELARMHPDRVFRRYLRQRFLPRKRRGVSVPHTCRRPRTCCCSASGLEPADDCPIHGGGDWPPRCGTCGRLMRYKPTTEGEAA